MTTQTIPFLARFAQKPDQTNHTAHNPTKGANRRTKVTRVDRETTDDK